MELFNLEDVQITKYLFLTGKGGVGKTSVACAIAVSLADKGRKVLLISTDPASNLQDVFSMKLNGSGVNIPDVPNLTVANLNPEEAAKEYRDSVIDQYKGKLPESTIKNMEEKLSGSCTVEIAAFDQFSKFITDSKTADEYDHIIFDTAPTGHTLRMLQLPSAWSEFIGNNTSGASCLGQLSGLEGKKQVYKDAVQNLSDSNKTTVMLISRPEKTSFLELKRASEELLSLNIKNQTMIINGVLDSKNDELSEDIFNAQQNAIAMMPDVLKQFVTYYILLKPYNAVGVEKLRAFFKDVALTDDTENYELPELKTFTDLVDDIVSTNKKIIFTMGKGGVGKTTVAANIAKELANKGMKVLLTTTDPANHLKHEEGLPPNIDISCIDEKKELEKYREEVLSKARETMNPEDIAYIEEDLRSPCTQEIAVFRAFAEVVVNSTHEIVVIDTAPSGHTLLLLDSTLSYHKEVQRTKGEIPLSVQQLLPRLRDSNHTEVVIVTLPEATPVFEASRLKEDLERAGITNKWWVVNKSLIHLKITNPLLSNRAKTEKKWVKKVTEITTHCVIIPFTNK